MIDDENDEEEITREPTEAQKAALKEISEKLQLARELVNECTALADEHNVSFSVSMINHSNEYVPTPEAIDKYGEVNEYAEYEGWQTSGC